MAKTELSAFRSAALASGLVTREQLVKAEELLIASGGVSKKRGPTDEQLAQQLVEMTALTPYQAEQLKVGRTKLTLGPYLVTDFIGQGGMGHVFKAVHQVMGRVTAVKVLPQHKSTPESIEIFQREIRMQAQLDHPNLVRAYDAGHDGNVHYLVTEYVPGLDLRRLVRKQGPLTMQQAARVIMQAAHGLHYAHQRGLIHRDVKPGNILVTPKGAAKVSDLGLADCIDDKENDPKSGKIVGTADYLSPEQILTPKEVTRTSDIYSLGCTLYYAVTAKVPFPGGTTKEKSQRHLLATPIHPRHFNPDVSEEFVEIIAEMMEKDPALRIQTAAEVASRLEMWSDSGSSFPSLLGNSPWQAPPIPGHDETQDTYIGPYEELESMFRELSDSNGLASLSETDRISSALQETRDSGRRRHTTPPPPPLTVPSSQISSSAIMPARRISRSLTVAITLAIAIPISMLAGAGLTVLLWQLFQ